LHRGGAASAKALRLWSATSVTVAPAEAAMMQAIANSWRRFRRWPSISQPNRAAMAGSTLIRAPKVALGSRVRATISSE
jgi:hypothetical protein